MSDPLTGGTTPGARGMVVSLLRYANRAKVAEALTARGYEVTRMTVNRWARGKEMPGVAAQMVAELFGHETAREAAPPQWVERLKGELIAEVRMNREVITEAMIGRTQELVDEMERLLGESTATPPDEDPPSNDASQDAGAGTRQPAKE